jgi:salicylate hydroxylase
VLTFPIDDGKFLNMVAFYEDQNEWADDRRLTKMSTREDALNDFKDFGPDVTKIMSLVQPQLPIVS